MRRSLAALLSVRSAGRLSALAVLLVVLALGEGAALYLLLGALGAFMGEDVVEKSLIGRLAVGAGLPLVLVAFLFAAAGITALQYLARRETTKIRLEFLHRSRMDLFNAIRRADWLALAARPASGFRYGFNELTNAISYALDLALQMSVSLVLFVIGLAFAVYVDARITAIMLFAALLAAVPFRMAERRAARAAQDEGQRDVQLHQRLDQSLADIKFLKFLGSSDSAANHVERDSLSQIEALDRLFAGSESTSALYSFASSAVMALALLVAWSTGAEPKTLLMLAVIAGRLFPRVTNLVGASRRLVELDARWDEFEAMMQELASAAEPTQDGAGLARPVDTISVEGVGFAYPDSRSRVISDLAFELKRGRATGLVGLTGSGKTTTIDLISGLLRPDSGKIFLDGQKLDSQFGEAWRDRIALVDQDSTILAASLRENLALRDPGIGDEAIIRACEAAGLAPLLAGLPNGLDTFLGDNGRLLSRGERQRVSIARALLRHPDLLILDEATASLNPLDEAAIIAAIERRKGEFATLTVAHRVSALLWVDEVLVLAGGAIVERGHPKALMAKPDSLLCLMATRSEDRGPMPSEADPRAKMTGL